MKQNDVIHILHFFTTGITLPRSDASLSAFSAPQGLFSPASCISSLLFCSTGIIFAARIHPYPALFYHRDYFAPASCISSFHFCTTGIISAGRIHPYLALLFHRDYFRRPVASLSCSFSPQGLLCPGQIRPLAESISASPFRQLPAFREAPCLRDASSAFRFHAHKQPAHRNREEDSPAATHSHCASLFRFFRHKRLLPQEQAIASLTSDLSYIMRPIEDAPGIVEQDFVDDILYVTYGKAAVLDFSVS